MDLFDWKLKKIYILLNVYQKNIFLLYLMHVLTSLSKLNTQKKKNPKINYFVSKTSAHALIWVFSFQP